MPWYLTRCLLKRKNKLLSLIFALLVFASCFTSFALPAAAVSSDDISLSYDVSKKSFWFPKSSLSGFTSFSASYISVSSTDGDVTTISLDDAVYDKRFGEGSTAHYFCGGLLNVTPQDEILLPDSSIGSLSALDLDNYNLRVYWKIDHYDGVDRECLTADYVNRLTPTLGLSDSYSSYAVPQINGIYGDGLNEYSNTPMTVTQYTMSREYLFEDTETISSILDGTFVVGFPFDVACGTTEIKYTLQLTLESTVEDDNGTTDTETENGTVNPNVSQNVDFLNPKSYNYDLYYELKYPDTVLQKNFSVSDFYTSSSGIKFRDSTDKYIFSRATGITNIYTAYDVAFLMQYADGYDDTYFTDSVFNVNKTTLSFNKYQLDELDVSLAGFRLEFLILTDSNFNYSSYTDYLDRVNSYYYGLEPFSIQIGDVTIPYDYFDFKYSADKSTLLATLELDGKNDAHRMYMRQIYNSTSNEITIIFTTPAPISDGVTIGIPSFGFWQKYDAPTPEVPPSTDTPDTPTYPDSGITQDDLDAAYQNGFNQGLSEGSDKNYVYGFINGTFNAVNNFYKTLANGIGLGGVTLGEVITSIIIIVVLVILLKKVM